MAQDEVGVKITADDSGLAPIDKAAERVKRFGAEAERAAKATSKAWADASTAVGQSLLAVSASFAAGFAGMGSEAAKLETSLRNVNTMAHLNEAGFAKLRDSVVGLSEKMKTKAPDDLAAALFDIYGAGLKGAKAMAVVEASAKLADAGLTDTKTAASALVSVMLAYRLPAEQAAHATEVMYKSVEVGKVSVEEMARSLPQVATKAAAFGVSLEEVGAAFAQLSLQSGSASEAATQLERAIVQIAAPTAESKKLFQQYHIEIGRTALAKKGLVPILQELTKAYEGADDQTRKALSSSEAMQAALVLTANHGKDYAQALGEMGRAEGSVDAARREQLKATSKQWEIFLTSVKVAAVKFGTEVLPLASKGLEAATGLVKNFADLSPSSRAFAASAGVTTMAVTGLLGGLFLLAPQLAALPAAFATARAGAVLLGSSLSTGLLGAFGVVTLAVGALYLAWEKNFLGIRDITRQTVEDVQHTLSGLGDMFPALFPQIQSGNKQGTSGDRLQDLRKSMGGMQNNTGTKISFTSPSKVTAADFLAGKSSYSDKREAKIDPAIQKLIDAVGKADNFNPVLDPTVGADPGKKHEATEEELRRRMVAAAESFIGTTNQTIATMNGMKDANNVCALSVREFAKRAEIALPVDSNPFDAAALRRKGLPMPANGALADSLFGGKVGQYVPKGQQKPGDMAFYSSGKWGPGVVDHVGMYSGNNEVIHASSSRGRVVRDNADSVGNLVGYVSPNAFKKGGGGFGAGGPGDDYFKALLEARQKYFEFIGRTGDDTLEKLAELDAAYKSAKQGVFTKEEGARLDASYKTQRSLTQQMGGPDSGSSDLKPFMDSMEDRGIERAREEHQERLAMIATMGAATRQEMQEKRAAEQQELQDRLAKIQTELAEQTSSTELAREQREALKIEQAQGITDLRNMKREAAESERVDFENDLQFKREMGQITAQEYLAGLQFELQNFSLNEEQKRALLLQTHQAKLAMDQEASASADQITNSLEQSFGDMLTGALTKQNNFNQTFSSLWKSVANTVIAELAKMLVKALALQVIMRGIFGVFGGIFGGAASLGGAVSGSAGEVGLAIAHSGGMVVPGGVQSFHSGGGVGVNLRPDEVLAKLQVGEMVLSRQQVAGTSGGSGGAVPQRPMNITVHATVNNGYDVDSLGAELARSMDRHAQGAY